jgi:SOS-response transcriptional repressor LexA
MSAHTETGKEIIRFLDDFENDAHCMPDSVVEHWSAVMRMASESAANWSSAREHCHYISTVLDRLHSATTDLSQLERARAQARILRGAVHLCLAELRQAQEQFKQARKLLRHWDHSELEGLAQFGQALTHKLEQNWPKASDAAQQALYALENLASFSATTHIEHLRVRIREEIHTISEAVISGIHQSPPELVRIPLVGTVVAGIAPIRENQIEEYLYLDRNHCNDADFAVKVKGHSMNGDGIRDGDIALIHQQSEVNDNEIAAAVITVDKEQVEVLKRYHNLVNEATPDESHWLFKSSNPSSEHIAVIPNGANVNAIQAFYDKEIRSGRIRNPIRYYIDAEVIIAGKYVGLIRMN